MDRSRRSRGLFSDTWRYALLGGVASLPFTAARYWWSTSGSEISLNAALFAGLVAGYLAAGRAVDADAAGLRTGVVSGLPGVAWVFSKILGDVPALSGPAWFETSGVALTVGVTDVFVAFRLALAGLVGLVGARVGGGVARRTGWGASSAG